MLALRPAALLLCLAQACSAQQCRTAQITFGVHADPDAGTLNVDRTPVPYGRGILCTRFVLAEDSAPVVMRFTRGANSCDPQHPDYFNTTRSHVGTLEGGQSLMLEGAAAAQTKRRRTQNPDFPPGCGGGSGARELPTDAQGGARDCQESCMWCSASLWQTFAVHLEVPYAEPYCLPIFCGGEPGQQNEPGERSELASQAAGIPELV
jgi:hypothetical protein|eukprot:COSAG01_NODE_16148_length_1265_cov_4.522298_1_plen_207_part_00